MPDSDCINIIKADKDLGMHIINFGDNPSPLMTDIKQIPKLSIGDFVLTLELEEPPPEILDKAKRELRESPELQKESISKLRQLLRDEEDLVAPIDNDPWLIRFLRPTKYYPESALQLIRNYYTYKARNSHLYEGLIPSHETKAFNNDLITVLPKRDQEGRRILVLYIGKKWNHKEVPLDDILKGCILFLEAGMLEPYTQICGAVVMLDMDGLSMAQACQFTPPFAKRIVDLLQDAVAVRVKGIHIVNQPYVFNMVYALFKPLLRSKLKSRLHFHGKDRKSLMKYLDSSCLPPCYGGTLELEVFHASRWCEVLSYADEEFEKINVFGYKNTSKK